MDRPLNLLIHGINYAPGSTGIPKYNAELGAWFAARGHHVEAIAGFPHYPRWRIEESYRGKPRHTERIDGVNVHRIPVLLPEHGPIGTRARVLLETSFSVRSLPFWLSRLLRLKKYDAVFAVCPPLQATVWPWLYHLTRGVPWIFHVQDLQVDAALALGMLQDRPWIRKQLFALERGLLRAATRVTTISDPMAARIAARGVDDNHISLLPNWADTQAIQPSDRMTGLREAWGFDASAQVVMCAGTMGEKHGLELVLQVAKQLEHDSSIQFVMVGEGSAKARLIDHARSLNLGNVRFAPLQPLDRLNELLATADLHLVIQRAGAADLVMPSKVTNIAAAGRPCIATADPGTALSGTILDHDFGLVVPPEDSSALGAAILAAVQAPEQLAVWAKHARRFAEEHLSIDRVLSRFETQLYAWIRSS